MRFLPAFLAVVFLAAAPVFADAARPNVVIIFTDDQGYADVGVFGAKGFATPNLDRMAREGRRFTDWHAAQAVCSASRAGLLTGCYPNRIGIHGALPPGSKVGISDSEVTLAQLAKSRGYATAIFGKWHLGDRPQFLPVRHGFDEWFGLPYSNDMWPQHPESKFPPLPLYDGEKQIKVGLTHEDQEQLTTQYAEHAVSFIERNKERPFFLYVTPNMPHVPLHVSDKFRGKSERGLYGDVIMEIDWAVGEIFGAIKRSGLDENTLVIFTSDNGPWLSYGNHAGSAGPLREGKGTTFDGGHREPFIARWPGKIPAGTVCAEPAMTIDIFPTVARLIGAALPAHKIDGLDIWPLFTGEAGAKNPHDAYFFYYDTNALQAVRSGAWKLFFPHQSRTMQGQEPGKDGTPGKYKPLAVGHELYNLTDDIGETKNVAEQNPEVVQRLEALAETARADLGDALTKRTGKGTREPGRWSEAAADIFARENLVAWCIVPFDTKKRGPEERAAMLERLGIKRLAYDYRAEHIPTFDAELDALQKHGLELTAWWFPTVLNDEARNILAVIARHGVHPQLWVMGGGGPVKSPEEQTQRIEQECARLRPIAEAAAQLGLKVGLYNHGGWFGEPENQLAILEKLALPNVGLTYNFHHGHGEIARFRELWPKMQPHLIALNINGMVPDGDRLGRGTITIGTGTEESWMLRVVHDSGWHGPVGLVGDRAQLDAEDALRDNLAGLEKLRPALALP